MDVDQESLFFNVPQGRARIDSRVGQKWLCSVIVYV